MRPFTSPRPRSRRATLTLALTVAAAFAAWSLPTEAAAAWRIAGSHGSIAASLERARQVAIDGSEGSGGSWSAPLSTPSAAMDEQGTWLPGGVTRLRESVDAALRMQRVVRLGP